MDLATLLANKELLDTLIEGVDATGTDLQDFEFESCTFKNVSLSSANLKKTRFTECIFQDCDLSNVKIDGARLWGCTFRSCKMLGIQWVQLDTLMNPSFDSCNLTMGESHGLLSGLGIKLSL